MMNRLTGYNEFILESQIAKLMLESQVVFSNKFLTLLNSIGRNEIVDKLVSLQSQDLNIQQNYIDTGSAKDTVTFTPERKVREILGNRPVIYSRIGDGGCLSHATKEKVNEQGEITRTCVNRFIFNRLGYEWEPDTPHWSPPQGTTGRILATTHGIKEPIQTYVLFEGIEGENAGKKCVINRSRLEEVDNTIQQLWTTQRSSIKVGRIARALLTLAGSTFTDAQIEDFVNKYKSAYDIMNDAFARFDIVEGDLIAHWYNYRNYARQNDGVLGSSCMKNAPREWLKIYTKNPSKCKLVILYSPNGSIVNGKFTSTKITGRAILWQTDGGDMFMERIYTNDDSDVDLYKRFCFHNNWWCRTHQQYGSTFEVENGNATKRANYVVTLEECDFEHYPFVDSLCFLNTETRKISNINSNVSPDRKIQSTGGSYESY